MTFKVMQLLDANTGEDELSKVVSQHQCTDLPSAQMSFPITSKVNMFSAFKKNGNWDAAIES